MTAAVSSKEEEEEGEEARENQQPSQLRFQEMKRSAGVDTVMRFFKQSRS